MPLGSMAKSKYSLFSSYPDGTIQTDDLAIQVGILNNVLYQGRELGTSTKPFLITFPYKKPGTKRTRFLKYGITPHIFNKVKRSHKNHSMLDRWLF